MQIPKKITPDCLKDTIVEIRYSVNIPRELLSGYVLTVLSPLGFSYVPGQAPPGSFGFNISLGQNQQVGFDIGNLSGLFLRNKVRVQLLDNAIMFNCLENNYIGWDSYIQTILEVITVLRSKELVRLFNRVNVRYISEFKNVEIFKNIKGTVNIENTGLKSDDSYLRLVDESQNIKTFVVLTNKGKRPAAPHTREIIETSLVDVNVFENFDPTSDINILADKLNEVHFKQKEVFFGLISESFLTTLNPEY